MLPMCRIGVLQLSNLKFRLEKKFLKNIKNMLMLFKEKQYGMR